MRAVKKKTLTARIYFAIMLTIIDKQEETNMVKIRLQRFGTTKRPFYRIVAAEASKKRDGRYLEIVGQYDPTKEPAFVQINNELALKWLSNGAQPTDTVKNLFTKAGINAAFLAAKKNK